MNIIKQFSNCFIYYFRGNVCFKSYNTDIAIRKQNTIYKSKNYAQYDDTGVARVSKRGTTNTTEKQFKKFYEHCKQSNFGQDLEIKEIDHIDLIEMVQNKDDIEFKGYIEV